jgi:2-phosphoglycerate kinase
MLIFLGGAPRVGKSFIAHELSKRLDISYCSTDDLRWGEKEIGYIAKNNPLFLFDKMEHWTGDRSIYKNYSIKELIEAQNKESKEVLKLVNGFIASLNDNKEDFILEGVALVPHLIPKEFIEKYQIQFFCIGNTNYTSFIEYSWFHRTQGDWLKKVDYETFSKIINYCSVFSEHFKLESEKRNIPYFEIASNNFQQNSSYIINSIIESIRL